MQCFIYVYMSVELDIYDGHTFFWFMVMMPNKVNIY